MKTTDVEVKLSGTDGNVFAIIGAVSEALKRADFKDEAKKFASDAIGCGSYDEVIQLAAKTVNVS